MKQDIITKLNLIAFGVIPTSFVANPQTGGLIEATHKHRMAARRCSRER
jgi:hypothetical protein